MSESAFGGKSRRSAQGAWNRAEAAVAATALFCPLALATLHGWTVAVAAALSLLACALAAWAALRAGEPFLAPAPATAFLAVTLFIGFQLVPLPPSLLGLLAPSSRDLFEVVLGPLNAWPAWRPLSLDPPATARELVKAIGYLALFLAAAQVARSSRARARLTAVLGVGALLVAGIGFGHAVWGASSLFGLFAYRQATPPFLTTFGNPNHLASFLALGGTALLAKVLSERDRKVATLWAFGYVAVGVGVALTLSQGGIVAFLAAQIMLGAAVFMVRQGARSGAPADARRFLLPGGLLLILAISAYLAWDALALELGSGDAVDRVRNSKLSLWPSFLPMARDHWLVGVGRGAFEPAYQRFQEGLGVTVTHPENLLFQWILELGIPVGLALSAAAGWALLRALRGGVSEPARLACVFGLAAVVLQQMVDFGLELGGLAAPATVAFAVAVARPQAASAFRRRTALALVPAAAAVVALGVVLSRPSLEVDGAALAGRLGKVPAAQLALLAEAAARRHPADYFPHLVAAEAWGAERPLRPDRVVAAASRAIYLHRAVSAPHRLAAQALRAIGRDGQARLEERLAYELGDGSALSEMVRHTREPAHLLEGVPDEPRALRDLTDELLAQSRMDEADVVARETLARYGESLSSLQRLATVVMRRGLPDEAFRVGGRMSVVAPGEPSGLEVRVAALRAKQEWAGAARLLETEGLTSFPMNAEVVLALADLRLGMGDPRGCREALRRFPSGADSSQRARALLIEAGAYDRDDQTTKAVRLMRQAVELRPHEAGPRWEYAKQLERAGRFEQAAEQADRAVALAPGLAEQSRQLKERMERRRRELEASGWALEPNEAEEP